MNWPQALEPFDLNALGEIGELNFSADLATIQHTDPDYPLESLETMKIAYHLLKYGAKEGLSPFQIGCFYTGNPLSVMSNLYEKAKKHAGNENPETSFRNVAGCIESAIRHIKEAYPKLVDEANQQAEHRRQPWQLCLRTLVETELNRAVQKFFGSNT